jgi:Tfp pilus assembly protein PilF
LFVLHPANTQAVNGIVSRPVLMATTFVLLSLVMLLRATRDEGKVHAWPLGCAFAAFAAAWWSHPSAILVPVLALACAWIVGDGARGRWRILASYWGLAVAFLLAGWAARTHVPQPAGVRLATWGQNLLPYAELTVLRRPLCALHAYPATGSMVAAAVAVAILVAGGILLVRRSLLGLALVWFVLALGAGTWFAPASAPALTEPRLYLALPGLVLVAPWLFAVALRQGAIRTAGGVAFAVLAIAAGTSTFMRNTLWHDEATLWGDVAKKTWSDSPSPVASNEVHARAQYHLGVLEREAGEAALQRAAQLAEDGMGSAAQQERDAALNHFESAEPRLREALEILPEDPEVLSALGAVLEYQGERDEALDMLLAALDEDPFSAEATVRVAALLQARAMATDDEDELRRAIDYYKRAERLAPLEPGVVLSYGMALASVGDLVSAQRALQHVVKEGEASSEANALRGIRGTLTRAAQLQQGASELLAKDPQNPEALEKMVQGLLFQKDILKASYLLEPLMEFGRVTPLRWATMAYVKAKMGAVETFLTEWPNPPKPEEGKPSAWALVVPMCATEGLWDAAETYANTGASRGEVEHPLLLLGEGAIQMRQLDRAQDYLQRATQADPEDPTPWVLLANLALARGDASSARRLLGEADKRGASAEALAPVRERLQAGPKGTQDQPVTIMR